MKVLTAVLLALASGSVIAQELGENGDGDATPDYQPGISGGFEPGVAGAQPDQGSEPAVVGPADRDITVGAIPPAQWMGAFDQLDRNDDDVIDRQEWNAAANTASTPLE